MHSVEIRTKDARAVGRGHPWVYRQALSRRNRRVVTGDVIEVHGERGGFVARGLFDADSPIAVRVFTRIEGETVDEQMFHRRIRTAVGLRATAGVERTTDAYRLVNAEGDRLPGLLVDRFGEWLSVTLQTPALAPWTDAIVEALADAAPSAGIYVRDAKSARLLHGTPCPARVVVEEPTARVRVFPDADGKSGLFTDMREARALLAPLLAGRSVLNLFAHTGAFSAAAARAGAKEIVSVDLSGPYLGVAVENVELSAPGYGAHTTVKRDVFDQLRDYDREGRTFDAVIVDPPTFSASRKSGTFNVKDRYRPLVRYALRVLEPGGLLACATNFRGVGREEFVRLLHDAAELDETDLRVLTVLGQPVDHPVVPAFPEGAYLHFALTTTVPSPRVDWRP